MLETHYKLKFFAFLIAVVGCFIVSLNRNCGNVTSLESYMEVLDEKALEMRLFLSRVELRR